MKNFFVNNASLTLALFFSFVLVFIFLLFSRINPISSDGIGYYLYLPQFLKYKDFTGEYFQNFLNEKVLESLKGRLIFLENGKYLNKYPIGVAILMFPFFIVADFLNTIFIHQDDYFSGVYSIFIFFSGIFYFNLGIFFLLKFLKNFFSSFTSNLGIILLISSTNLFYYSFIENAFSHVYSFFVFTVFLNLVFDFTNSDYKDFSYTKFFFTGLFMGLIVTIRNTNIIALLLLLVPLIRLVQQKLLFYYLKHNLNKIFFMFFTAFFVFSLQMIYWHVVTNYFLYFSYIGESFNFLNPQIVNVLFSVNRGLFFWTPVLIFAVLGFILIIKQKFNILITTIFAVIVLLQIYLVSSWWMWSYGFSFGHRGFTEFLVFFIFPICFFIEYLFLKTKFQFLKVLITLVFIIFSIFNFFQMYLYFRGLLRPDVKTFEEYINSYVDFFNIN